MNLGFLRGIPGIRRLRNALPGANPFLRFAPPGHFYSPLPDIGFIDRHKATLFDRQVENIPGIQTQKDDQLALIDRFSAYYGELPFRDEKSSGMRYHFGNPFFSYGDAIALYSMLRHRRPKRIIEVGSGFSSAVMLDTNDLFCSGSIALTFIDPFPERLLGLLTDADRRRHEVIRGVVQEVPLERFAALQNGDILFIDSSHVAKVGSDVVHLLTHILPRLNLGVLVHFHDVFWPFEYPEDWIRNGRAWNEDYMLKAFLQFNSSFRIAFFNSYLAVHHRDVLERRLPLFLKNTGGSLWIERTS